MTNSFLSAITYAIRDTRENPYFEWKYFIHPHEAPSLEKLLELRYGINTPFRYSKIKTIYFDTPELKSYYESVNGDYAKVKVRLREYLEPKDAAGFLLEAKVKRGNEVGKYKIYLPPSFKPSGRTLHDILRQIKKEYSSETRALENLLDSHPVNWLPMVEVSYIRKRYLRIDKEERYNLDTNISAEVVYSNLSYKRSFKAFPFSIFEAKGPGVDQSRKEFNLSRFRTAFSKYA